MLIELELKIALTYAPIRNKYLVILCNSEHESLHHLMDGGKMTNEIQSSGEKCVYFNSWITWPLHEFSGTAEKFHM